MLRAEVRWDLCQACDPCSARLVCRTRAVVKMDADGPAWVDLSRCNGCGDCLAACPHAAIALRNSTVSGGSRDGRGRP